MTASCWSELERWAVWIVGPVTSMRQKELYNSRQDAEEAGLLQRAELPGLRVYIARVTLDALEVMG